MVKLTLCKLPKNQAKRSLLKNITFVTTIIVSTSPLLKGRSCSDVPLKLYLATHSVPCGHGVYGNIGRSQISKHILNKLFIRHVCLSALLYLMCTNVYALQAWLTWISVIVRWFNPLTDVSWLLPLELVNTHTRAVPIERHMIQSAPTTLF